MHCIYFVCTLSRAEKVFDIAMLYTPNPLYEARLQSLREYVSGSGVRL